MLRYIKFAIYLSAKFVKPATGVFVSGKWFEKPGLIGCVIISLSGLSGCSAPVKKPQEYVVSSASLPDTRASESKATRSEQSSRSAGYRGTLELSSLQQGQHHPAIAALFKQAEHARQKRQWRKALKYLDQARQIQPRNAAVLYRQAWVNLQLAQASKAEQLLLRAKAFSTRDKQLMRRLDWLLADTLDAQGKTAKARIARQRATH